MSQMIDAREVVVRSQILGRRGGPSRARVRQSHVAAANRRPSADGQGPARGSQPPPPR